MKRLALMVILFFFLSGSALADLTKNDIQEIRTVVKDELQVLRVELHQVEKRLDQRMDGLGQRLSSLESLMYVLLAGMFALVGFVLWDRRTAVAPLQRSQRELEDREQKLEKAILEYSRQEPKLAEILKSFGLL
ncbi:MAG: hypothetical protein KAT27_11975 [Desulfobacterales bacterium]|nr:hypothetical protein [Desulfobacterales bacterium]